MTSKDIAMIFDDHEMRFEDEEIIFNDEEMVLEHKEMTSTHEEMISDKLPTPFKIMKSTTILKGSRLWRYRFN
jgi:hypothetical protein